MELNEKKNTKINRDIDLSSFKMQNNLNPKIWDLLNDKDVNNSRSQEYKMKYEVKKTLLKIADDYFESLDLSGVDIEDVTMTGSLANYNWSKYSDVDLHIVVDYNDLPMEKELVSDFFKSKTSNWNKEHDVKIYGYDVELYIQDINEPHHSTGVYSILNNEWKTKPEKKKINFNDKSVKEKSERLMDRIEEIYDEMDEVENEETIKRVDKLIDKIKKIRQSGLETGGEFSVENIVFKVLRRNGMLDKLYKAKTIAYDKSVTLESDRILEYESIQWIKNIKLNPLEFIMSGEYHFVYNIPFKVFFRDGTLVDDYTYWLEPHEQYNRVNVCWGEPKECMDYSLYEIEKNFTSGNWVFNELNDLKESTDWGWVDGIRPHKKIHDLVIGDLVIPSCIKESVYLVADITYTGDKRNLTRLVSLKKINPQNGEYLHSGAIIRSHTDIGENCIFNIYEEKLNESNDIDWIRNINPNKINEAEYASNCYDIMYNYFSLLDKRKYNEWIYYIDNMSGSVVWSNEEEDFVVYATPFWDGRDFLPIDLSGDDGTYYHDELELPKFDYEEELLEWLEYEYPKIIYKWIKSYF